MWAKNLFREVITFGQLEESGAYYEGNALHHYHVSKAKDILSSKKNAAMEEGIGV
ncbi:MAG: hypothetical protein WDN67_00780 [Candidatus Moraniibacteriota bacterium]